MLFFTAFASEETTDSGPASYVYFADVSKFGILGFYDCPQKSVSSLDGNCSIISFTIGTLSSQHPKPEGLSDVSVKHL